MRRVLVLDDDRVFRKTLCRALSARGHEVTAAGDGAEAVALASHKVFDAAIIDMMMPGMDGLQALRAIREVQPGTACVMLTGYGSIADAVRAIKLGGHHYLTKPCGMEEIERVLESIGPAQPEPDEYQGMIGRSPAIREAVRFIQRIKGSALPVLISGESGTGKELVARALHYDGPRKDRPFIAVNCASLKTGLLENELFGHVKGAFTGASDFKEGLLKAAHTGTLFIDEIGDMEPAAQASLLRFMEAGVFRPLGSSREERVDTRIVAAVNKDIEEEVRQKRFRLDFYYRLNVCRVHMPPLRSRPEDIPALAAHFLARVSEPGRPLSFSPEAVELLKGHQWPGNVRELLHLVQRAAVLANGPVIGRGEIAAFLGAKKAKAPPGGLEEAERGCITAALEENGWNISRSAKALGIDRRTLQRRLARYGLKKPVQ